MRIPLYCAWVGAARISFQTRESASLCKVIQCYAPKARIVRPVSKTPDVSPWPDDVSRDPQRRQTGTGCLLMWIDAMAHVSIATYVVCIWLAWSSGRQLPQHWRLWALLSVIPILLITTGVIHLFEARVNNPHALLHATISLATAVALVIWVYHLKHLHIDLSQYRQALEAKARYDELTGVLRREAWIDAVTREIAGANRAKRPIAVIEFDIDDFKAVNDTYGHAVGDQLLKSIAYLCTATSRPTDIVGRVGGEEFMLALPETGRDEAMRIAERLRLLVAQHQLRSGDSMIGVTISLGVAVGGTFMSGIFHECTSLESLMKASDDAMYRAKSTGKNCVR